MSPLPEPEASSIRVAEYLTELPPREMLEQKLKAAVAIALERLGGRDNNFRGIDDVEWGDFGG